MCALCTFYLGTLTKSRPIHIITQEYKDLALRGLRDALTDLKSEYIEAIVAASFLLSWVSESR